MTGAQIGIISDTHGLLRPQAIAALANSDLILHAGDIGKPEVIEALKAIAPVIAVRGNHDTGAWAEAIPEFETVKIEGVAIHLLHIVQNLRLDLEAAGIQIVVSGHSHKPAIAEQARILSINPGSAGAKRFKLPVSVARLQIYDTITRAEIVELAV